MHMRIQVFEFETLDFLILFTRALPIRRQLHFSGGEEFGFYKDQTCTAAALKFVYALSMVKQ